MTATTETPERVRTPDLLDILPDGLIPDVPDGMVLGWRSTRPDLRSCGGYRWPFPGRWAECPDDGRDLSGDHPDEACPSDTIGGLCLAKTWDGARSGGVTAAVSLLVAYHAVDVLGASRDKLRVRRCLVLDIVDITALRANLTGAYLTRAYLTRADLTDANLTGADLTGAYLARANLTGADLTGANLTGAVADGWTRWPVGFDAAARGVVVR